MGFLSKLFGLPAQASVLEPRMVYGDELVHVVGESNYQHAIRAICGAARGEAVSHDCLAVLLPEPTNQFDSNAVLIEVDGHKVGYLSRQDAIDYREVVATAADQGRALMCEARISGRGGDGETTMLGVFLELPSPDGALALIR